MTTTARQFFRDKVLEYDSAHYGILRSFMSERLERMLEIIRSLPLPEKGRALDAGCGPGRLVEALASTGCETFGIDTSPQMLMLTRERVAQHARSSSVHLALSEIERLPFPDGFFDLVCTAGVTEYLPSDDRALAELSRILRPGGHLLYPITNNWSPLLWIDGLIEGAKRTPRMLAIANKVSRMFGQPEVRPRHFSVRKQNPSRIRSMIRGHDLDIASTRYFYYLPVPHPFERLCPGVANGVGRWMDRLARTPLAPLAEGYLLVARKRHTRSR